MLKRLWHWFDDRTGISKLLDPMLKHPVPRETTEGKSAWLYIFGIATLSAFLLQIATGTALALNYIPSAAHAYGSLEFITQNVFLGWLMRGMHFFGASAMVLFVSIHMLRVFLTASYKFPREVSWLSGVILLVLTMAMAFSGQLLRWDETGVWSVVVSTYFVGRVPLIGTWLAQFLMGGETLGGATLSRFYFFHVFIAPLLTLSLVGFHLYLVIHNGISELPKSGQPVEPGKYRAWYKAKVEREDRPYWPWALWKEIVAGGGVVMAVVLLALIFGPKELGAPANPVNLTVTPQPDWFLLWYYTLLTVKPVGWEGFFMVYLPILVFLLLLALPFIANKGERSPLQRPWAVGGAGLTVIALIILTVMGIRPDWVPDFETRPLSAEMIPVVDEKVDLGAQLFFERGCQYCHAVAGEGGEFGPDLTDVRKRMTEEMIAIRTINGIGFMPPYRDILTAEELDAIVAFLSALAIPGEGFPDAPP
jgi:ubiquinol-cytochrome c reductase cytochrome b subunit